MKLLHVISSVNPLGGGPIEWITQLGRIQIAQGHQVEIASLDSPNASYLKNCELSVHALGPALFGYSYNRRLVPWIREHRQAYDVVMVNGIWQFHSFGTWQALRKSGTPYIVFTHGMLDPWFKKAYPLKHIKKWLYWPWADYRVLRDAEAVIFTCEEERVLARSSFWLYRCNEVVVTLGTSIPVHSPEESKGEFLKICPELVQKRICLFMGRIHPKKGCDLLIDAFAEVLAWHPEWQLVFAGPDQVGWQKELQERAMRLGIANRITWTGMIRGALKWGALHAAEVFVLPSHQENFGIGVSEALASGVPALISNKVNIWREIETSGAGLVAEDSCAGTSSLLKNYLAMSPANRSAMRTNARKCFRERFEIGMSAESLHAVLGNLSTPN